MNLVAKYVAGSLGNAMETLNVNEEWETKIKDKMPSETTKIIDAICQRFSNDGMLKTCKPKSGKLEPIKYMTDKSKDLITESISGDPAKTAHDLFLFVPTSTSQNTIQMGGGLLSTDYCNEGTRDKYIKKEQDKFINSIPNILKTLIAEMKVIESNKEKIVSLEKQIKTNEDFVENKEVAFMKESRMTRANANIKKLEEKLKNLKDVNETEKKKQQEQNNPAKIQLMKDYQEIKLGKTRWKPPETKRWTETGREHGDYEDTIPGEYVSADENWEKIRKPYLRIIILRAFGKNTRKLRDDYNKKHNCELRLNYDEIDDEPKLVKDYNEQMADADIRYKDNNSTFNDNVTDTTDNEPDTVKDAIDNELKLVEKYKVEMDNKKNAVKGAMDNGTELAKKAINSNPSVMAATKGLNIASGAASGALDAASGAAGKMGDAMGDIPIATAVSPGDIGVNFKEKPLGDMSLMSGLQGDLMKPREIKDGKAETILNYYTDHIINLLKCDEIVGETLQTKIIDTMFISINNNLKINKRELFSSIAKETTKHCIEKRIALIEPTINVYRTIVKTVPEQILSNYLHLILELFVYNCYNDLLDSEKLGFTTIDLSPDIEILKGVKGFEDEKKNLNVDSIAKIMDLNKLSKEAQIPNKQTGGNYLHDTGMINYTTETVETNVNNDKDKTKKRATEQAKAKAEADEKANIIAALPENNQFALDKFIELFEEKIEESDAKKGGSRKKYTRKHKRHHKKRRSTRRYR